MKTSLDQSRIKHVPVRAARSDVVHGLDDITRRAQSIRARGLYRPIKVIALSEGAYQVIGEHLSFDACRYLNWSNVPVVIETGHG